MADGGWDAGAADAGWDAGASDGGWDAGSDAGPTCPSGEVLCDGACIDPDTDVTYCGATDPCADDPGETCLVGETCSGGACTCDGCDDGNACTVDSCSTADRCQYDCIDPPPNVAVLDCAGCAIGSCVPGYRDEDGVFSNGCEVDAAEHYVDASNTGDPLEDGSAAHPFDTLAEGVAAANADDVVHVAAGTYDADFDIGVPGVAIEGTGCADVTVVVPAGETGFHVQASRFAIGDLTIQGGRYAIHYDGTFGTLTRGWGRDVCVSGQRGGMDQDAAGVRADDVTMLEVDGLVVDDVLGGTASDATGDGMPGGAGSGLALHDVTSCSVTDLRASNVVGGTGGEGWGSYTFGGTGGIEAGLRIVGGSGCVVDGVDVTDVTGGTGGYCGGSYATGGRGGDAAGVHVSGATDTTILHVAVIRSTGGAGGEGWGSLATGGTGGNGLGVHLGAGSDVTLAQASLVTLAAGAAGPDAGASSMDGSPGSARGIELAAGPAVPPAVSNVIWSGVAGWCAWSDGANAATDLTVSAAIAHGCASGTASNAMVDVVSTLDPEFVDRGADDLRVSAASPAIDTGDPTAACGDEPAPNGCRANIGRWGNTSEAASLAGASHCTTCPP